MNPKPATLAAITASLLMALVGSICQAQPLPGEGSKRPSPDQADRSPGIRVTELREGSATREPLRLLSGHVARVGAIAFFPKGDRLLSVSNDGTVRIWSVESGQALHQYKVEKCRGEAAISPDGQLVAVSADHKIVVLDLKSDGSTTGPVREFEQADAGFIGELAFSPDGRQIASANRDGSATIWETSTGRVVQRLLGSEGQVKSLAFNSSGNRIVTGGYDKTARIWDVASGKPVRILKGHDKPILTVAISPDGTHVLTAGFDKAARLWDFETSREIRGFRGHTDTINSVAFSPDGRLALTASSDHTVRLWDIATGEELHRFLGHTDYVLDAVFAPDGRSIASSSGGDVKDGKWVAGEDFAIRLWKMPQFDRPKEAVGIGR